MSAGRLAALLLTLLVLLALCPAFVLFTVLLVIQVVHAVRAGDDTAKLVGNVIATGFGLALLTVDLVGCRALVRQLRHASSTSGGPRLEQGAGSLDRVGKEPRFTDALVGPPTSSTAYLPTSTMTDWRPPRPPRPKAVYAGTRGLVALTSMTLVFGVVGGVAVTVALAQVHRLHVSERTQTAAPVVATVITDRVTRHTHQRTPDTFTTALVVRREGADTDLTVVHVDAAVRDLDGRRITVVLDPQDPGYAELPGRPVTTSGDVVNSFIGVAVFGAIALGCGWMLAQQVRLRTRARADIGPGPYRPAVR